MRKIVFIFYCALLCFAYVFQAYSMESNPRDDVREIVTGLCDIHRNLPLLLLDRSNVHCKAAIVDRINIMRSTINHISDTVSSLVTDSQDCSKSYSFFRRSFLLEAFTSISKNFIQFEQSLNDPGIDNEGLHVLYSKAFCNITYLFSLFNGQLYKSNAEDKQANKKARKHNENFLSLIQTCKKRIALTKGQLDQFDDLANMPNLSETALMFIDPSYIVEKGLPIIESSPRLRSFLKTIGLEAKIKQIEDVNAQGIKLTEIMQKAKTEIPDQLRAPLISFLKNWGKTLINPTVWLCYQLFGSGINLAEQSIDTIIEKSKKPISEKKLFAYLIMLGNYFQVLMLEEEIDQLLNRPRKIGESFRDDELQKYERMSLSLLCDEHAALEKDRENLIEKINEENRRLRELKNRLKFWKKRYKTVRSIPRERLTTIDLETIEKISLEPSKLKSEYRDKVELISQLQASCHSNEEKLKHLAERIAKHPFQYLRVFFDQNKHLSTEVCAFLHELVITHQNEFKTLLKRYLRNPTVPLSEQFLFNNWLKDIIQQESKQFLLSTHENAEFLSQIRRIIERKECNLELIRSERSLFMKLFIGVQKIFGIDWYKKNQEDIADNKKLLSQIEFSVEEQGKSVPNKYFLELKKVKIEQQQSERVIQYEAFAVLLNAIRRTNSDKNNLSPSHSAHVEKRKRAIEEKEKQPDFLPDELPKDVNIPVNEQRGADCGYHALFNALNALGLVTVTEKDFIEMCKKRVVVHRKKKRQSAWTAQADVIDERYKKLWKRDSDWLDENEIQGLLEQYPKKDKVMVILDIQKYIDGKQGLDLDVINQIAEAQQALRDEGNYERVYVIATGVEGDSYNNNGNFNHRDSKCCHWIAIKQIINNGTITYKIMNSLGSWNCESLIATFKFLMHEKHFKPIVSRDAERYKDLIKIIEYNKAFKDGGYALKSHPTKSDSDDVIINETPQNLIERILNACFELLEQTKGVPFHNCMGYIKPIEIVENAVDNIKRCNGKNLKVLLASHDEFGNDVKINLESWNPSLEALENLLNQYKEDLT